jgi:two-component system OmpR family response regulator
MGVPKVLIADDEPTIRLLLETNLHIEGFPTVQASNGEEALRAIDSDQPDVLLLDLMMPVLDGWGVLDRLTQRAERPKVIVVSAKASDDSKLEGWRRGCDDFITKPFELDDLLERIEAVNATSAPDLAARRSHAIEELESAPV